MASRRLFLAIDRQHKALSGLWGGFFNMKGLPATGTFHDVGIASLFSVPHLDLTAQPPMGTELFSHDVIRALYAYF
jgi:hypothetical protein